MKNFSSINRMKAQGFSLIEILLVIGIIAVLAIAAFIIFPQVQASSRANTEQSNIMTIAAGTKNLFNGRYTGLNNTVATNADIFPSSMTGGTPSSPTVTSSWGGTVTLAPVTGNTTRFTIAYTNVPSDVCLKLVPGLVQNFESVNTLSIKGTGANAATPTNIVSLCTAADPLATLTLTSN